MSFFLSINISISPASPPEFREAILSFLNPFNENYNKHADVSVMFIAFDFAAFAELNDLEPKRSGRKIYRRSLQRTKGVALSEIYRICHEQIMTLFVPRLHLRMAAISVKWMRGDPLPEIIDENHKRTGGKLSSDIRTTLNDIEQEIRFKYFRLTACYIAVWPTFLRPRGTLNILVAYQRFPLILKLVHPINL